MLVKYGKAVNGVRAIKTRRYNMLELRSGGPYIWITWLIRLLTGESSCEWAYWFRAQHDGRSWKKAPSTFQQAGWQMEHTALLNTCRDHLEDQGYEVRTESQNSFVLKGKSAAIGGKPDLIALKHVTS